MGPDFTVRQSGDSPVPCPVHHESVSLLSPHRHFSGAFTYAAIDFILLLTFHKMLFLFLCTSSVCFQLLQSLLKYATGFPGGTVVESLPANAGDTGSSPGLGRSHMPQSDWAREPQLLSLRVWSLCSVTKEATIVRGPRTAMKSGPRSPQLEKALAQKQRPNTAKNKQTNKQTNK